MGPSNALIIFSLVAVVIVGLGLAVSAGLFDDNK